MRLARFFATGKFELVVGCPDSMFYGCSLNLSREFRRPDQYTLTCHNPPFHPMFAKDGRVCFLPGEEAIRCDRFIKTQSDNGEWTQFENHPLHDAFRRIFESLSEKGIDHYVELSHQDEETVIGNKRARDLYIRDPERFFKNMKKKNKHNNCL